MNAERDLQDIELNNWEQVIRDLQAKQMALITLLVEKGVCTEQEFHRTRFDCDRMVEEEKTRKLDEYNSLFKKARYERVDLLYKETLAAFSQHDPTIDVDIFRSVTSDLTGEVGTIFLRLTTRLFSGRPKDQRDALLSPILSRFNQRYPDERVWSILLAPEEQEQSAASLQFDMMIEQSNFIPKE